MDDVIRRVKADFEAHRECRYTRTETNDLCTLLLRIEELEKANERMRGLVAESITSVEALISSGYFVMNKLHLAGEAIDRDAYIIRDRQALHPQPDAQGDGNADA